MKWREFFIRFAKNWPAKVISLVLALLLAQFYRGSLLEKRLLVVPLHVTNHEYLVLAEQYPQRIHIQLWGEGQYINSIREDDISASLDLSNLKSGGTHRITIQVRLNGISTIIDPIEINPEPESLLLKIEQGMRKEVPVTLALKGIPADGYEITETSLNPAHIEIHGPVSLIEKTNSLFTEELLIENRTNSFSGTATVVNHEPLIGLTGSLQVQYTVKMRELTAVRTVETVPIHIENLSARFKITSAPQFGILKIQGTKSIVEAWNIPEPMLSVVCSGITEPGEYTLPVIPADILTSSNFRIKNFEPQSIQITVAEKNPADIENTGDASKQKNEKNATGS